MKSKQLRRYLTRRRFSALDALWFMGLGVIMGGILLATDWIPWGWALAAWFLLSPVCVFLVTFITGLRQIMREHRDS